jgi:uncharacterized protein (UPF0335 family)
MDFWDGKSKEEWREIWRLERIREDEMLAFCDEVDSITHKALAEKFDLKPARVGWLIRRRDASRRSERLHLEIKRLKENDFTTMAEKLWMELGWLATELEKRRDPA